MHEEYKTIPGYPQYKISNFGKVKSYNTSGIGSNLNKKGRILKPQYQNKNAKSSYVAVTLCKNGKQKQVQIHRLVALTFLSNPENKKWVNHKDCNKENNKSTNLEWCTPSENQIHAVSTRSQGGLVINYSIAQQIRKEYKSQKVTMKYLSDKYNLPASNISCIISNKSWRKEDYEQYST